MSRNLIEGVTVLIHTLNNEIEIDKVLASIKLSNPDQIIVADGSSRDGTASIARKYATNVVITAPGFAIQHKEALKLIKYKYLLVIEPDHIYPEGFIHNLKSELIESNFYGIQATLLSEKTNNYFERGISAFYQIHQKNKGARAIIGGASIYLADIYLKNIILDGFNGYSIDTRKAEIEKEKGLLVGLGYTTAYHSQELSFKSFRRKYFNYGKGDYDFYNFHKAQWNTNRKFKSITHIASRYFFNYPLELIKINKTPFIPYLWLAGIIRYTGWIYMILKIKK